MWRTARKVSELSGTVQNWQGEFAPLSVIHRRLVDSGQQQDVSDGRVGQQQGWTLQHPASSILGLHQDQRNQAVQAAFAEWSRQGDPPTLALAFDDQLAEVLPLDLVRQFDLNWLVAGRWKGI